MENSYVLWFYPALSGGKGTVTHPVTYHQNLPGRAPRGRRFQIVLRVPVHRSPVCIVMSEISRMSWTKKSENPVVDPTPCKKRSVLLSGGMPVPVIFTNEQDAVSCFAAADAVTHGFWTSITFTPPGPGFIFRLFQQGRWGGGITLQRSVRCRFGSHFAPPDLSKNPECKPSLFLFFIRSTSVADHVTQS